MLSEQEFFKIVRVAIRDWDSNLPFPMRRLYRLLMPHLRGEFPREQYTQIIEEYFGLSRNSEEVIRALGHMEDHHNGESESVMCDICDGSPESHPTRGHAFVSKPLCATCGGSGRILDSRHPNNTFEGKHLTVPCPDCKPKCLRCGMTVGRLELKQFPRDCLVVDGKISQHRFADERGAERRLGSIERRRWSKTNPGYSGRRESQRRSTTLVGALRR